MIRRRALLIIGIALFLCLQTQGIFTKTADLPRKAAGPPAIDLLWQARMDAPVSVETSPDGKYMVAAWKNGKLRCMGEKGRTVWEVTVPDADRAVLANDGSAAAYSYLNPARTSVYFIAPDGKIRWQRELDGAIWSADASWTPGRFVIGTGERYSYLFTLSEHSHKYKRWRLPGVPCSVGFTLNDSFLVFGTWQDSGVYKCNASGGEIFRERGKSDRLYTVQMCRMGNCQLVVSKPNRSIPESGVALKNADMDDLWRKEFPAYDLAADVAPDGGVIAFGFRKAIAHKDEQVLENRISVFNRGGQPLWEKGGLFGKWNLLQVCASGNVLLYDATESLYIIDPGGKILIRRKLPSEMRAFWPNRSRESVAVYLADGQLMVFSAR